MIMTMIMARMITKVVSVHIQSLTLPFLILDGNGDDDVEHEDDDDDHNEECSHLLPSIAFLILDDDGNDDDVDDDDYDAEDDVNYVDVCDGRISLFTD